MTVRKREIERELEREREVITGKREKDKERQKA